MVRIAAPHCSHPLCHNRMQRLYVRRLDKTYIPVGWRCPTCHTMKDEPEISG